MSQEEFDELNTHVAAVTEQDVHLGRVLALMASHLPGYSEAEQAKADAAKAEAEQAAKEAEAAAATPEAPAGAVEGQSA